MLFLFVVDTRRGIWSLRGIGRANHGLFLVDVALLGCADLVDDFDEPSVEDFPDNLKLLLGHISGT